MFICTNFSDECEGNIAIGTPQTCTIDNVLVSPASLTVNKEIFGCDNIVIGTDGVPTMDCNEFPNDSPGWISCDDPAINDTSFCLELTENLFDIEVLDDENNQIAQFEGSAEGETIENLEPGTYTVNEIVSGLGPFNQLSGGDIYGPICINNNGFEGGGLLTRSEGFTDLIIQYVICFEYEDEQGNDCRTITLAAGESRTCTVKNYILDGFDMRLLISIKQVV